VNTKLVAMAALGAVGISFAFAHLDDPKEQDRIPRFEGPAYRPTAPASQRSAANIGVFDSENIELLSWLPLNEFGSPTTGSDCWGYVAPQSNREYAIMTHSDGTAFIEVTNPGNPQIVANIAGPNSLWRDVKVYGNHAYSVSEGGSGIQIFQLANIDFGNVSLVGTIDDFGTSATHNVAIDEESGFLYRIGGGDNGLRIYSLANPSSPTYVGSWTDRYVHDAQIVTYTEGPYAGRQIAFCCGGFNGGFSETGLCILDVTNKSNIQQLACLQYNNPSYSHQGWLTEDRQYFYLNDELDEQDFGTPTTTRIIDVSDLDNPVQVGTFSNGESSIDHNLYTLGNLILEANYRSGLRVFDASNPLEPTEIAFFDTYPADNLAQFNGIWSVYPYLPSGVIIGSDLERGLFVWRIDYTQFTMSLDSSIPELLDPAGGNEVLVDISTEAELDDSTLQLIYETQSASGAIDLELLSGTTYRATFPALPCGESAAWYITASLTTGQTRTIPGGAPSSTYDTLIANGTSVTFNDDAESDPGWNITGSATDGQWNRGVPVDCGRCDPPSDADNSGQSWLTDNSSADGCNSDVDGGQTILTSPQLDASNATAIIEYSRWYSNGSGCTTAPQDDGFLIEVSDDNGSSWTTLESLGALSGGWVDASFLVSDIAGISNTDQFRIRFIATDTGDGSVVEAGVDGIKISSIDCDKIPTCPGDINGDSFVNVTDLLQVIARWSQADPDTDIDGSGIVDVADLLIVIASWGPCDP